MESKNKIKIDVQRIKKLPTLSHNAEKILRLTVKDTTHLDELVNIIENDPPIMLKVLSIANIVYLGLYKPITTIKDALLKIGFKTLKNIALSVSIFSIFKFNQEMEISYKRLYRHSIATGIICQIISERFLDENLDENFTAGVIHDIGLFAIHNLFFEEFEKIEKLLSEGMPLSIAEEKVLGITHGEVGKWLLEFWGLPEIFHEVALYHDEPIKSLKYPKTVALVNLSNYISNKLGYSPFEVKLEPNFNQELIYKMIGVYNMESLIIEIKELIKDVEFL